MRGEERGRVEERTGVGKEEGVREEEREEREEGEGGGGRGCAQGWVKGQEY